MTIKTKNILSFTLMFGILLILAGTLRYLFSVNEFLLSEINQKYAETRWLILVQGETLEIDEVGRLLSQEPDVEDVKLISSADVFTKLTENQLFLQDVSEEEKKKLPPVWQVQWKPFATALSAPDDTVAEIKGFKNVIDVALDRASIQQILVLRRVEHGIRIFKSLYCLLTFLVVLFFGWRLIMMKSWKKPFTFFVVALLCSPLLQAQKKALGELKSKNRDLEKINAELSQIKEEKEKLKREEKDLSQYLDKSRMKVQDVERTLLFTHEKRTQVGGEVAKTKNRRDQLIENIGDHQDVLHNTRQTMVVASLVSGEDSLPFVYSSQIYHQRTDRLKDMKANRDKEDEKYNALTENYKAIQQEFRNQEMSLSDIKSTLQEKQRLREKKLTRQEALDQELRNLERSKEELSSLIDNLRTKVKEEQESEKLARKQKGDRGQSPILARSLPWPMKGKVTKRFGRQPQNEFGSSFISNGIVINSSERGSVKAVADGTVLYAGQFMSYGSMVVIEHAGDWFSVYGFLHQWNFEKGSTVKKGEVVGIPGDDPNGGSQVYFELRFYGKATDPEPWLSNN